MKRLLPLLAVLLALFAGCGDDGDGDEGGSDNAAYSAQLRPLNGSGVKGEATFKSQEDGIAVRITARGLEPGQILPTYVKGFSGTREARCPDSGDELGAREARALCEKPYGCAPLSSPRA